MQMFSEPESWLGLRSERAVAGEMAAPVRLRAAPSRPAPEASPPMSWREVRSVIRRTLGMLLGR
jgi:hypothetical protein